MSYSAVRILAGAAENEVLGDADRHIRLITDGSSTGGALSTMRVKLRAGDPGALPHTHRRCTETFFVLSGVAEIAPDFDTFFLASPAWDAARSG
jgi:mannose-6-phosphate isomerase-like protein (cupin superfamily)